MGYCIHDIRVPHCGVCYESDHVRAVLESKTKELDAALAQVAELTAKCERAERERDEMRAESDKWKRTAEDIDTVRANTTRALLKAEQERDALRMPSEIAATIRDSLQQSSDVALMSNTSPLPYREALAWLAMQEGKP